MAKKSKRVSYEPKGQVAILRADGVGLRFGRSLFRCPRWVVSNDVLRALKAQNPDVEFRMKSN
jgi:hypothetical protein